MAVPKKYRQIVRTGTVAAGGIGVPGAFSFGADIAAMSTTWIAMILSIADKSGHRMNNVYASKLCASVLSGVGAYVGGSKIAMKLLHLIPAAGTLAAIGVNSLLNALFTYKMGHALSRLFDKGDFDEGDIADMAATLLTLVACFPTAGEIADFTSLMTDW
ncbi:MAG: DUF697 domain-containing protein [Bacteroidota bacterium]